MAKGTTGFPSAGSGALDLNNAQAVPLTLCPDSRPAPGSWGQECPLEQASCPLHPLNCPLTVFHTNRSTGMTSTCPRGRAAGAVTSGSRGGGQEGGHSPTLVQKAFKKVRDQEAMQATGTGH